MASVKIDDKGPGARFDRASWTFSCDILLNQQPTGLRARFRDPVWSVVRADEVLFEASSKLKLKQWLQQWLQAAE